MSAPIIWIAFPVFLGVISLALRKTGPLLPLLVAGISLVLAWAAWQLHFDQAIVIGSSALKITSVFSILGRSLTLENTDRPLLILLFLGNAIWLAGSFLARPGELFTGVSQIALGLFVAALSVDPFLYAAIFLALIVLTSVPMLAKPGEKIQSGLLRYLNFQLMGMPFILFVGWMLAGVEASPGNSDLVFRAGIMLALGFALLLAVFPFHSWLPMLAEEVHPFSYAFLVFLLPFGVSIFALGFFERFAWIREIAELNQILLILGALIATLGGIWAAIQNNLGRQLGFIMVYEIGLILVAIGIDGAASIQTLFALTIARLFSLFIWAISVSGLREASRGSLNVSDISRIVKRHPILLLGLLISLASFAGLPLSASFFPKFTLSMISASASSQVLIGILVGQLGIALAMLRTLMNLAAPLLSNSGISSGDTLLGKIEDPLIEDKENPLTWLFLGFFTLVSFILALSPHFLYGDLQSFLQIFPQLSQ